MVLSVLSSNPTEVNFIRITGLVPKLERINVSFKLLQVNIHMNDMRMEKIPVECSSEAERLNIVISGEHGRLDTK